MRSRQDKQLVTQTDSETDEQTNTQTDEACSNLTALNVASCFPATTHVNVTNIVVAIMSRNVYSEVLGVFYAERLNRCMHLMDWRNCTSGALCADDKRPRWDWTHRWSFLLDSSNVEWNVGHCAHAVITQLFFAFCFFSCAYGILFPPHQQLWSFRTWRCTLWLLLFATTITTITALFESLDQ